MTAQYYVGIDLGTSNTVVASAREREPSSVEAVLQRTSATTLESLPLFASCAFASLTGEAEPSESLLETDGWLLGDFAKRRGTEVPERLVSSSKSWLCHPRVDKHAPILPWGSEDVPKLSPVDVATRLLAQVRQSWDASHPEAPLAAQRVVLTVPASFDEVARELTLEAAQRAGLSVRLLEEPQAAFYDAMERGELAKLVLRMREQGRTSAQVLVCDLGGGTTDLSLLGVTFEKPGAPEVTRLAVGNHLLLGGDNMDLALAHLLEPRMCKDGERLEPREMAALVYAARRAKEALLSSGGPDEHKLTLLGRGSNLLGNQKRATLTREEATRVVIDGFLPVVDKGNLPQRTRAGLVALGLPYERDVAITRHIAAFIARHVAEGTRVDALLLNGGVFRASAIRDAVKRAIAHLQREAEPIELAMDDPDTAVAKGAASFARALAENGKRISGGAARSYFIRVGKSERGRPLAICAIPKGSEEGTLQRASEARLKLLVGKPARFELFSSDNATCATGAIVEIDEAEFDALPPLVTVVPADATKGELQVVLEAELTPVGTVEIHCVEAAGSPNARRFRLAFDLRPKPSESMAPVASTRRPPDRVEEALAEITRVYGKGTQSEARDAKNLQRELERLLGERDEWSADTSRALADRLIEHTKGRKRTLDHERVFFQLTGYCLRPGFGAAGDDERCAKMAPLFAERLAFPKEARSWQQLFICYRRIAAGLSEADQLAMRNDLDPFIAPSELKLKKPKSFKPESSDYEILELLAHLEHVPPARRADLGSWILERTWTKRDPRLWAAIGRLGARVPAYASAHRVTSSLVAEKWLDQLLADKWADLPSAPRAASDMARMTGDRARDVSPSMRERVATRLEKEGADAALVRVVREVVEVVKDERATFFGERLPSGLRL